MGKLGFVRICSFKGIFRLCLCFVVVGIIIFGATGRTAAASTTGSLPDIRAFTADPLTLKDGDHAVYMFEVYDATKIQVVEAGEIINEYNGPPSTVNKGKAMGRTTYQIRTGDMDAFDTILRASNPSGQREQKLTISFATKSELQPASLIPPVSDNETGKKNKWGPQTSAPVSLTSSTALLPRTGSPYVPAYAECPSGCNCLTPDQAAQYGFKQKCSEERCFSADKQVNSYCYNKTASGWCCKDGKIASATEAQCKEAIGSWYATEAEAIKACQTCWCCAGGRYGQTTTDACAKMYGTCYSTQAQASERCQPPGYCCINGKVSGPTTQTQCSQMGGAYYTTQAQAQQACQTYWCCSNGQVYQSTTLGRGCYTTQAAAQQACQPTYWCCRSGQVYQSKTSGTGCYTTQAEATRACQRLTAPIQQ